MSGSNCCFLSCMQVSQEKDKMVWYSHPVDVGNLISGFSAFSKPSLNIWQFSVHVLLKPGLKNVEHYFASVWDECNCAVFEHSLAFPFFGIGMKTDLFKSHSRMSGSRWVITPSWLSGSLRSLYWAYLCMKCSLGISNFLHEISSLSHSIVFLFLCIDHWGRLSYLSSLFFGTQHLDGCIIPFPNSVLPKECTGHSKPLFQQHKR